MFHRSLPFLGSISILLVTGCAQTRQTLGLERSQPDEFSTLDRPPLSMPPSLNLKPPVLPQGQNQEARIVQDKAKTLILPSQTLEKVTSASPTSSSAELLSKAGASQRQEDIRRIIDEETQVPSQENLASKILYWQKPDQTEPVVDPRQEPQKYGGQQTTDATPLSR